MVGLINIGAGLSQMGAGLASSAQTASIETMKDQLETQRLVLANQLEGQRETALEAQRQTGQLAITKEQGSQAMARTTVEQEGALKRTGMEQSGAMARTQAEVNKTPDAVREAEWYKNATPEQRAAFTQTKLATAGMPAWAMGGIGDGGAATSPGAGTKGAAAPADDPQGKSKYNEEALQGMPAPDVAMVKGMVDGSIEPPTTGSLSRQNAGLMRAYVAKAKEYDPSFDESQWKARVALRKSWQGDGKDAQTLQAIDQAINHLDEFDENAHALNNKGFTPLNAVQNQIGKTFDDPRIGDFTRTSQAFSEEMGKVYKGAGVLGEKELDDWKKTNDINSGPETLSHTAQQTIKLFDGRMDSLANKWRNVFGQNVPVPPMMSPDAQEIYDRLSKGQGRFASGRTGWPTSGPASDDIKKLNENPQLAAQFDKKYGAGAAKKYLGRWTDQGGDTQAAGAPTPGNYIWNPATGKLEPAK